MRSLLMVPSHRRKCLEKASTLNADALVFDLEDSVPNDQKERALITLRDFLDDNGKPNKKLFVRVNPDRMEIEWKLLGKWLYGVMIPKVKTPLGLGVFKECKIPILIVVETPMAVLKLEEFFEIHNVIGGVFGVGDYSAGMNVIDRNWIGSVNSRFMYAKQRIATIARAFDKQALDTSFFIRGIEAENNTRIQWLESASWGFTGASPIHPSHIDIANKVFQPSRRELRWSREVIDGTRENHGEVWVDREGFVVGPPHVKQIEGRMKWQQPAQ